MSQIPDRHDDTDRRFVERLAEHYRPEPPGPAERARFDAALRERTGRRSPASWLPALLTTAAALALAWWAWPVATSAPDTGSDPRVVASSATSWETEVLLVDADATLSEEEYLPDDYVAIAYAFIDGS